MSRHGAVLDGSRAYLHAVIDNFSRRILAWKVSETFDPAVTAHLLVIASKGIAGQPTMLADGGVENFNGAVDELVAAGVLKRVLARTDVTLSNSLIESWWRILKHQWLYLNTLDSVERVRKLVTFLAGRPSAAPSATPHLRLVSTVGRKFLRALPFFLCPRPRGAHSPPATARPTSKWYSRALTPIAKGIRRSKPLFVGAFRANPADSDSFALSDHLPRYAEFIYTGRR